MFNIIQQYNNNIRSIFQIPIPIPDDLCGWSRWAKKRTFPSLMVVIHGSRNLIFNVLNLKKHNTPCLLLSVRSTGSLLFPNCFRLDRFSLFKDFFCFTFFGLMWFFSAVFVLRNACPSCSFTTKSFLLYNQVFFRFEDLKSWFKEFCLKELKEIK